MAVHAFAQPALAILGDQTRLIILSDQIIKIVIGFEDYIAAASPIAAAWPPLGPILLTLERDRSFAAVPRAGLHFDLIDKHDPTKKARPKPRLRSSVC
jgi:hypothetical protein